MPPAMPANSSRHRYVEFFRSRRARKGKEAAADAKDKSAMRRYLRDYARWLWPYRWAI